MTRAEPAKTPLPLLDDGKASPSAAKPKSSKPRWLTKSKIVLLGLAVLGLLLFYVRPPFVRPFFSKLSVSDQASTGSAISAPSPYAVATAGPDTVVALGRLTPHGKTISLSLPYGAGDARIAKLLVDEGDRLTAGAVVAELDSLPQLRAAVSTAQANLTAQKATLKQTRANVAASLLEAQAALDRGLEAADQAERERVRQHQLQARDAVSKVQLENSESAALQAKRESDRLASILTRWQGDEDQPDIALAQSRIAVSEADLSRAQADLARGLVTAPTAGTVIALHARAGEHPGTTGLATYGDIENMEAELEVYQTDITRVKLGQKTILTSPSLNQPLNGVVNSIGLEVQRQTILSSNPAANTDARVILVTIALDETSKKAAIPFTNLELTGRILTEPTP